MKRFTAFILALVMASALIFGFAGSASAAQLDLAEIYTAYGLGQTILVQGSTDQGLLMLHLVYPDGEGFTLTITRLELAEGIEINIGEDWELGIYTLLVGVGSELVNEYHFDVVEEPVDHRPSTSGGGTSSSNRVVATRITISPSNLELEVGESAKVQITSENSSVRWETDDGNIISITGTTEATVTGKRTGTAVAWAYSGNNYATLNVTVVPATKKVEEEKKPAEKEPEPEKPDAFTDLADVAWAKDSINALAKAGVVNGIGDGTFAPQRNVTRAEFVKMIVEGFGFKDAGDAAFEDINGDEWYADVVLIAANNGIVNGYNGRFSPLDNISCQDAALILRRVADMKGIGLMLPPAEESEAAEYAREAVALLKGNGIINDEMSFSALENASRAQSAYMIYYIYRQR